MHLLLIRHGESVDNVAGLYAGSRDSPLTSHGVLQTRRLGTHLASRRDAIGPVTHIFTSNLQRAYRTAEAIADAQHTGSGLKSTGTDLKVMQLVELREKDFGSAEGVKYAAKVAGRADGSIPSDSESRDGMMVRVNRFIANELKPVLETHAYEKVTVAVVAHGLILGSLLQALETRFSTQTPVISDRHSSGAAWSNTGILHAKIQDVTGTRMASVISERIASPNSSGSLIVKDAISPSRLTMIVQSINNTHHLNGLKKTKGGIGSAQFDARQQTVTAFFLPTAKKRKAEDDATR